MKCSATDINGNKASWSNYGPITVALGAPGVNIYSTKPSNSYQYLSGTSMSTPFVAGAAALLVQASDVDAGRRDAALAELHKVRYRSLLSITLGYPRPPQGTVFAGGTPEDPRPYYALVNTDRGHDVSWLAIENDKGPSRVPAHMLALVVQMSGAFTAAHFDAAPEQLAAIRQGVAPAGDVVPERPLHVEAEQAARRPAGCDM